MSVLNPKHLLDQADRLISSTSAGAPRQVDIRRAISAAYYSVFHYVMTMAADEFIGNTKRRDQRYTLVYRSVDHRTFKELCIEIIKNTPTARYRTYINSCNFNVDIKSFARAVPELQEKRHIADYDPSQRVRTSNASLAISMARSAIAAFDRADLECKKMFLTLLLFPPR
jgi:uncharacterized protein (UPF0332 family)